MKGKTIETLFLFFIALTAIALIVSITLAFAESSLDKTRHDKQRLADIATIAERCAYDTGDTTDMWWAVVEIAGGGK